MIIGRVNDKSICGYMIRKINVNYEKYEMCNNGIMCTGHNQVQIMRAITKIQNNGDKEEVERHLYLLDRS